MATRHRDKKGNHIISYKNSAGKWKSKYLSKRLTINEVNKIVARIESEEINNKFGFEVREAQYTIPELISMYKKYVFSRQGGKPLTENTIHLYNDNIKKLEVWLLSLNINKMNNLNEDMAFNFVHDCKEMFNIELSSIKTIQVHLIRFLTWCNNRNYYGNKLLISEITRLPIGDGRERYFTVEELKVMFAHKAYSDTYKMLFYTGLRISELCELKWSDYNPDNNVLTFYSKDQRRNRIELNDMAFDVMMRQKGKHDIYIFVNTRGGKLIPNTVRMAMGAYAKRNDIPEASPHVFRHSFASHLALNDVSIQKIQKLMRHKNIKETMRYAHLSSGSIREASNKLRALEL